MKLAYVCAPYRAATHNEVYANIQRAREMTVRLLRAGYAVFCPHTCFAFMEGVVSEETMLEVCCEIVKRCDLLVVPDLFEPNAATAGMIREMSTAHGANIPIVEIDDVA